MGRILFGSYPQEPRMVPDTTPPRVGDLKKQSTGFGLAIPTAYAKGRNAGTIIWKSPVGVEVENYQQRVRNPKGGWDYIDNYVYSYVISLAIGVGEGLVNSVRAMWANDQLVFDREYKYISGVTFYNGSDSQPPDPIIQSFEGAANTPAFRGLSYVVLERYVIDTTTRPKESITLPQFEFLVDGSLTPVHKYNHRREGGAYNGRMFNQNNGRGAYEPLYYSEMSDFDHQPIKTPDWWDDTLQQFSYEQIVTSMYSWAANYPGQIITESYGKSRLGRDLIGVRVWDYGDRPIIGVSQGIHGDERACAQGIEVVLDQLMNNPDNDPVIAYVRDRFTIYIAATINPDAMASGDDSIYGGDGSRNNAADVNLNRNWPYHWEDVKDPDKGSGPASEPETYNYIDWMTYRDRVKRVIMWVDVHGWNSRNEWGFLTEQIYHEPRAQRNQRGAFLYSETLLGKRDFSDYHFNFGRPTFYEFRSHHKPYIYTWVKNRCRPDAWCGLFEYPQKESIRGACTAFLDLFKGMCMAASDGIEDSVGGFIINPSLPPPMNENSFLLNFIDEEDRPDLYSVSGLRLKHYQANIDTDESRSFVRCYRPDDSAWPNELYGASAALLPGPGYFVTMGGDRTTGASATVNAEILYDGYILLGSGVPEPFYNGAGAADSEHVYTLGGWNGGYINAVYRAPVPASGGRNRVRFWEQSHTLPEGLQRHTAHIWNGKLVVIGGRTSAGYQSRIYAIDIATGAVTTLGHLPIARGWHSSQLVGDTIYIFGGWTGASTLTECSKINLNTNVVSDIDPLPFSRAEQCAITSQDESKILLFWGRSGSNHYSTVYQYEIATNTMSQLDYQLADDADEEVDPLGNATYGSPDLIGSVGYCNTEGDMVLVGGKFQDGTISSMVWELDLNDSSAILYQRKTDIKRWGYIRPRKVFRGNPGDQFYATMSVRNVDPMNDKKNPYVRLVVYFGTLINTTRKIKLGYTVPPQKDAYGYYTYTLPFTLQEGETEFRVYYRQYTGNTSVDLGQLQVVKSYYGWTPVDQYKGRETDYYEVLFREHMNNPHYRNPGYKEITYWSVINGDWVTRQEENLDTSDQLIGDMFVVNGEEVGTNLQKSTGVFSPLWSTQMSVNIKILEFICEPGLEVDAAELWYESVETTGVTDPVTGFLTYEPNGHLFFRYRLKGVWHQRTVFDNMPLNHAKLNREYRGDLVWWFIQTHRGVITFGFSFYGRYSEINIAENYPNPNYHCYSFICYGARSTGSGVIMRASRNLSTILRDLCIRAGIPPEEVDTTGVTGSVTGYMLSKKSSFKSFIEPLRNAYLFDVVDGEKLRFITRGSDPVDQITADELVSSSSKAPYKVTRKQERELPNRVAVLYIDEDRKFEQGTQYASRGPEYGSGEVSISVPVAMTANMAAQVADTLLFNEWAGRVTYSFAVPMSKLHWDVGDTINLIDGNKTFTIMLTTIEDRGDQLTCKGVEVDGTVFNSDVEGSTGLIPVETIDIYKDSVLMLMDIPLLQDQDSAIEDGFYLTTSHDNTQVGKWSGAKIDRSLDGGETWNGVTLDVKAATYGVASNTLPAPARFTMWDDASVLDVVIKQGSLESTSKQSILLNAENTALIGNEIITFANAELIAENTYRLSGFLRGLQGTEGAARVHGTSERFILLRVGDIQRKGFGLGDLHKQRLYRAATLYTEASAGTRETFTNTGAALRPYSPCNPSATRNSGDILLKWVRRSRIGNGWNDGSEVPLGEAIEQYEIDVMSGTTVVRTMVSNLQRVTYSASQQIEDFGSTQASVTFRIYQMSDKVGRGFKLETTQ